MANWGRAAVVLLALVGALAAPAWAESGGGFRSGNELLAMCEDDAPAIADVGCMNYIAGVSDGVYAAFIALGMRTPYCLTNSVTQGQLRRLVLQYLRARPERGHLSAASLVGEALQNAFPCN